MEHAADQVTSLKATLPCREDNVNNPLYNKSVLL